MGTECSEGQTRKAGRPERRSGRCSCSVSRRAGRSGVRASIRALTRGNARRAKGRRKVDESMILRTRRTTRVPMAEPVDARRARTTRRLAHAAPRFMLAVPSVWNKRLMPLLGLRDEPDRLLTFSPPVLLQVRPPTREPCAGDPHARFGGEGDRATGLPYPYRGEATGSTGAALNSLHGLSEARLRRRRNSAAQRLAANRKTSPPSQNQTNTRLRTIQLASRALKTA